MHGEAVEDRNRAGVRPQRQAYPGGMRPAGELNRPLPRHVRASGIRPHPASCPVLDAAEYPLAHEPLGPLLTDVGHVELVRHAVEQRKRRRPQRSPLGHGRERGVESLVAVQHHVLQAVDPGLDGLRRLRGGRDVGGDRTAASVRLGDDRVQYLPTQPRAVAGDGAVDDLDEVEVLSLESRANVSRGGDRVVEFNREVANAECMTVHQRVDGVPSRSGDHAARRKDSWSDELARALGCPRGDHPLRVVTGADHRGDPAAEVGAPVEQQLAGRQLARPRR